MALFCHNFEAHALNAESKKLIRLRCKKWDCEYCARFNAYLWRKCLREYIANSGHEDWSLVTITARGRAHRNSTTLEAIIKNWDRLHKRLVRLWGKYPYVRVYERHATGESHAHMLVKYMPSDARNGKVYQSIGRRCKDGTIAPARRYRGIAHKQLKSASFGSGLGFICDFSPVLMDNIENSEHAVNRVVAYITKYLLKGLGSGLPKGTRRIQTSRDIGTPNAKKAGGNYNLRYYLSIHDIAELGEIEDLSRKKVVNFDDFLESDIYPPETIEY